MIKIESNQGFYKQFDAKTLISYEPKVEFTAQNESKLRKQPREKLDD